MEEPSRERGKINSIVFSLVLDCWVNFKVNRVNSLTEADADLLYSLVQKLQNHTCNSYKKQLFRTI